jgi:STE24 endopeptidase
MATYEKAEWITSGLSLFFMIMAIIFYFIGKPWFSIPFGIGVGISFFIAFHIVRTNQSLAYRYRRALWGNNSERLLIQFLPGYVPLFIFILSNLLLHSPIISYVLSVVGGAALSLVFPYIFYGSLKKPSSPELDEVCRDLPFEFKRRRLMEVPEDLPIMNAWVAGTINPVLVVTSSMFQYLNREELRAVLLHEVGHVRGKHLFILSIFAIFLVPSCLLPVFTGHDYVALIMFLLFMITIIWLRHSFEIKADEFAVREMGEEGAVMIDALQKISSINNKTASKALGVEVEEGKASTTHPSLNKRVERIKRVLKEKEYVQKYKNR